MVVTDLLIVLTIFLGIRSSFGVFFKSIEGDFNLNRAATSSIFSAYMVLGAATAILGGWALDRYGPRVAVFMMGLTTGLSLLLTSQVTSLWQLYITYSLLLAIGTGAGFVLVTATASRWFVKRRGLALGIGLSGEGLGILVAAPFAAYLISTLGWRMSYIVIGVIAGVVVTSLAIFLRRNPAEMGLLPDGSKAIPAGTHEKSSGVQVVSFSLLEALRTTSFWFLWMAVVLYSLSFLLLQTHIVPHITDFGIPATKAAVALALVGGGNALGRIVMGAVSDKIGRKVSAMMCALFQFAGMIWVAWSRDIWMFYLAALVSGFANGGLSTTVTALLGDTFGVANLGVIMGALVVGFSLGAAIGPFIGGFVFDVTNSYFIAFLGGAAATLLAVLFLALTRRKTKPKAKDI